MIVNKSNFAEAIFLLFYGSKMTDYNSECFSSRDVQFAVWGSGRAQASIDAIRSSGYDPVLIAPIISHEHIDYTYFEPVDPTLKRELDDQFSIEIDDRLYELGRRWYANHYGQTVEVGE